MPLSIAILHLVRNARLFREHSPPKLHTSKSTLCEGIVPPNNARTEKDEPIWELVR